MDLSKSLEEIGKYFNEILGYLLPGLTLVVIIIFFLDPDQIPDKESFLNSNVLLLILLSYVIGYVVYGISLTKERIIKNIKFIKNDDKIIKQKISAQEDFRLSKQKLKALIPEMDMEKLTFNDIRNFAMAYVPEVDQKIYTFMFRSDLFKHTKDIFLFVSIWGFLSYISNKFININLFFRTNDINIYLIMILFILTFPLNEGKKRFLMIAYKIQFNIFLAKTFPLKNENK